MGVSASTSVSVTLQTRLGNIELDLNALCKRGDYDNTHFFRITTEGVFIIQGGDPTNTGEGGKSFDGDVFEDENLAGSQYSSGTVAMANSGKDTNGSQFFIVYKDSQLPPAYTVFGHVASGLGIIQQVSSAGTADGSSDGKPRDQFIINKCIAK
ncbi:hypothetical protein BGZ70_003645 [Mortierella alpina]|uniref:Peptidyl-prolyl cis-trans isomerase n=1 Tax=Mortierella alpina TaxID=64518 RepID=A0A9P6IS64_MORAP|nr:hypothetical protein BGZ70_003645 [Mortierella alpina]